MDEIKLFESRMLELSQRARAGGYYTASHFLTPAEQKDLSDLRARGKIEPYALVGGFEGAERKYAIFGDAEEFGYEPSDEACWLSLAPSAPKFADTLSHRDFLGSLMALGIKRELLGDILVVDNIGYLYLQESIAPYIEENLTRIKRTDITVTKVPSPPEAAIRLPDVSAVVASSERLDALIAAVYKLSRDCAKTAIERELCAIDGRVITKPDATVLPHATVSLRGYGRFLFEGILSNTRKGKLRLAVRIFS